MRIDPTFVVPIPGRHYIFLTAEGALSAFVDQQRYDFSTRQQAQDMLALMMPWLQQGEIHDNPPTPAYADRLMYLNEDDRLIRMWHITGKVLAPGIATPNDPFPAPRQLDVAANVGRELMPLRTDRPNNAQMNFTPGEFLGWTLPHGAFDQGNAGEGLPPVELVWCRATKPNGMAFSDPELAELGILKP